MNQLAPVGPVPSGTVLDAIIAGVLDDLAVRQQQVPLETLVTLTESKGAARNPMPSFRASGLSVIAEVKRSSPSKGALADIAAPAQLAAGYERGGAAAISVLTEQRRFRGSLADLDAVRAQVGVPLLRKDFMVSDYQVYEARVHGADLILLIVAALEDPLLRRLYNLSKLLGMTPLVEVHTAQEARRAIDLGAELIGVNNRNLKTLEVDLGQFGRLVDLIDSDAVKVAESGILRPADAALVASQGADVVLVGEALVKSADPDRAIQEMIEAAR